MFNLLETAIKLPIAAAWDVISLGNMGEGSSTADVLQDYKDEETLKKAAKIAQIIKDLNA